MDPFQQELELLGNLGLHELRLVAKGAAGVEVPLLGERMAVLQVTVEGRSVDGEAVRLERAGLARPVMSATTIEQLAECELVTRRLAELAAADALTQMRATADRGDWPAVDRLLDDSHRRFDGNEWVAYLRRKRSKGKGEV